MPQHTETQRPPGFLMALWLAFVRFIENLFRKSPLPSPATLPTPVTAASPKAKPTPIHPRPTSAPARATHQGFDSLNGTWVKEPTSLKRHASAASPPMSSTARTPPACHSRTVSPRRTSTHTKHIFHPPTSPFPDISLSGIFATPPSLASPRLPSEFEFGPSSLVHSPDDGPALSPGSPSPFRLAHPPSPPFRTPHSTSPCTPTSPSSASAVMVQLDRSIMSPTTMSDGSLEVISLGDRRGFIGSPISVVDTARLPSPWSPIGKTTSVDVWMSVDGLLVDATGPVDLNLGSQNNAATPVAALLSPFTVSRMSSTPLYSSPLALDALGISVFVNLDDVGHALSSSGHNANTPDETISVPMLDEVREENHPTLITRGPHTPRKRRETIPSVTRSHVTGYSARATKRLSTPLTKLDNVEVSHVRSTNSISSMAYELRLGLFGDGRSMTAIENIISFLDQASPESIPPNHDTTQPVEAG